MSGSCYPPMAACRLSPDFFGILCLYFTSQLKKRKENSANQEKFSKQGRLIAMQITSEKVYAYDLIFFWKTC